MVLMEIVASRFLYNFAKLFSLALVHYHKVPDDNIRIGPGVKHTMNNLPARFRLLRASRPSN